jgi:small-conductance mechanosensitive channel
LLLAHVRRSNQLLECDNTRMERELAIRREPVPSSSACDEDPALAANSAQAKLVWIENYIFGTLAQTLWALNARAEQLEEQTMAADQQQQTHRLLQMTHAAYDQLRDLMTWLQGNVRD